MIDHENLPSRLDASVTLLYDGVDDIHFLCGRDDCPQAFPRKLDWYDTAGSLFYVIAEHYEEYHK